jgi:hypothetical protein
MTTSIFTSTLKLRPQDNRRRGAARFSPPTLAPGLQSHRPPVRAHSLPVLASQTRIRTALSLFRDVLIATLVTLVFLSPFLYFVAPPFSLPWTIGVGIGVVALTIFVRRRDRE